MSQSIDVTSKDRRCGAYVAADWDRFVLRAWVDGCPYQEVGTDQFLRPDDLLRISVERAPSVPQRDLVVFGARSSASSSASATPPTAIE